MEQIIKKELKYSLKGFKRFCKLLKIKPTKEEIEKVKEQERIMNNEKESNNFIV